jgi:hypothetical protein
MKTQKALDSFDVVEQVISTHNNISHFYALDVPSPPPLQERLAPKFMDPFILREAAELKRRYALPFWDAYFVAAREDPSNAGDVFRAALIHDEAASRLQKFESKNVSSLRQVEQSMKPGKMLAISSKVELRGGEVRHIPMLDFHCTASSVNLTLAQAAIAALRPRTLGFLLRSGKSYHYYGLDLLTRSELFKFLARATLLGPIVDTRWAAHQIIEGACALRIGSGHGYENLPSVVSEFL